MVYANFLIRSMSTLCLEMTWHWQPHCIYRQEVSPVHSVKCVSKIKSISQLSFMQYMGMCVFSLPIYLMMIVRTCVLYLIIIIKSEVWPVFHLLRVRSWNYGMCCMSFYFLTIKTIMKWHSRLELTKGNHSSALRMNYGMSFACSSEKKK